MSKIRFFQGGMAIPHGKMLPWYLLPVSPPLMLPVEIYLSNKLRKPESERSVKMAAGAFCSLTSGRLAMWPLLSWIGLHKLWVMTMVCRIEVHAMGQQHTRHQDNVGCSLPIWKSYSVCLINMSPDARF